MFTLRNLLPSIHAVIIHIHPDGEDDWLEGNEECKDNDLKSRLRELAGLRVDPEKTNSKGDQDNDDIKEGKYIEEYQWVKVDHNIATP